MKKLALSAFVVAGFMFTSCKDDDNNTTEEGTVDISKMYLPLKITADDYTTIYTYNNKGQVTKIVESDGYEYIFNYSGNQLVEVINIDDTYKTTYTFTQSGTKLTLNMKGEFNGQTQTDSEELTLDSKGNLINDGYFTYSYDANGNIVKMASDDGEEIKLTFDSKNGIFKNLNLPKWISTYILENQTNLVNNTLSVNLTSEDFPEDNFSGTVKYEYNADNYPVKLESSSSSNETYSQTIEYTKK